MIATDRVDTEYWETLASGLGLRTRAYIDGEFCDAATGETFPCISPISGEQIAQLAACDEADVDIAVRAARRTFEAATWRDLKPAERKRVLLDLASAIRDHAHELAALITLDMGKPVQDSLGEVGSAAGHIQYFAEAVDKLFGEVGPTDAHSLSLITREPIGVVAAVVPWNYPLAMIAWKIGPALAAGNCVIVKPAEQASLVALRLAELADECGIPPGTLNVIPGFGETAGAALGLHADVDKVAFTGSAEVGKFFLKYAGESNMKAVSLECGGKSPNIIFADCPDLSTAAATAAYGCFVNQGEMCDAGSRILVDERIGEEFVDHLLHAAGSWRPSNPWEAETTMGALVDESHMRRVLDYIGLGTEEGAIVKTGGGRCLEETGGFYVEPTIFTSVENSMRIAQEEIFGPVGAVISFRDNAEAIRLANDSMYGLAAAIWTKDLSVAHTMARALRVGTVYVNTFDQGDVTVPFGGYKQSGIGRDKSLHAVEKYTQLKTTWIALSP